MIHCLCAENLANKTMTDKEQRTRIQLKTKKAVCTPQGGLTLVEVYTAWAGPCTAMATILSKIKVGWKQKQSTKDKSYGSLSCRWGSLGRARVAASIRFSHLHQPVLTMSRLVLLTQAQIGSKCAMIWTDGNNRNEWKWRRGREHKGLVKNEEKREEWEQKRTRWKKTRNFRLYTISVTTALRLGSSLPQVGLASPLVTKTTLASLFIDWLVVWLRTSPQLMHSLIWCMSFFDGLCRWRRKGVVVVRRAKASLKGCHLKVGPQKAA